MRRVKVKGVEYKIPETWDDINYDKFLRIKQLEEHKDEKEFYDFTLERLEIFTDMPASVISNLNNKALQSLGSFMKQVSLDNYAKSIDTGFVFDGKIFVMDKIHSKYLYAFLLDTELMTQEADYWNVADQIASVLYRPATRGLTFIDKLRYYTGKKIDFSKYEPISYEYDKCIANKNFFRYKVPLTHIAAAVFFCLIIRMEYTRHLKDCSQLRKNKERMN